MRVPLIGTPSQRNRGSRFPTTYHHAQYALEQDREFRTCLCLHVRTGTLLLGLFQMMTHIIVLLATITLVLHPNAWHNARQHYNLVDSAMNMFPLTNSAAMDDHGNAGKLLESKTETMKPIDELAVDPLSEETMRKHVQDAGEKGSGNFLQEFFGLNDRKSTPATAASSDRKSSEMAKRGERLWTLTLTMVFLFFTCLLVYGVLYRKPSHLLPYFSVQVFDFVLSCLTVMGYMTYMPYVKNQGLGDSAGNKNEQRLFAALGNGGDASSGGNVPLRYHNWEHVNAGTRLAVMTLAFLMLALKAYFMGMVWACYKYLVMWHRVSHSHGNVAAAPTNLREAWQDLWNQIRRPTVFSWLPTGARSAQTGSAAGGDVESQNLLTSGGEERVMDMEETPVEPPTYEDLLKQPANANMPPPYFKEGGSTPSASSSEVKK